MKWALGMTFLVCSVVMSSPPTHHVVGVALLCAALLLSSRAVATPGELSFSSFPVPILVAGALPEVGAWWATVTIILDSLLSLGRSTTLKAEYFLRSSIGVLASTMVLHFSGHHGQSLGGVPLTALIAYAVGALAYGLSPRAQSPRIQVEDQEERLLRVRSERALKPLRIGQLLAGFFAFYFASSASHWVLLVLFFPVMSLFELAAENIVFRVRAEQAEKALQEVAETRAERIETRRALDQSDQERRLLEQLNRALRDIESEKEGVSRLISFVNEVLPDAAVAFFPLQRTERGESLGQAIGARRLQASALASLASLARTAHRDCQLLHRSRPKEGLYVLAAPVTGYGVFCALRQHDAYTEGEAHIFEQICKRGRVLLGAAKKREEELGEQLKLMSQVELLEVLSRTGRHLFDALDRPAILQEFISGLGKMIPHSFGLLKCREWIVHWDSELRPQRATPSSYEGRLALNLRLPSDSELSVRYLDQHFFEDNYMSDLASGVLLAFPFDEKGQGEFVLVASDNQTGYAQEHRDLMSTLADQMLSALVKAERLEALQSALRELAEKQSQLIQSSKMTALGTMVAGVAHEINTPLGAISLSVEAAQMQLEKKPKDADKKLGVAIEAADKIRKLVDRLLVFSHKNSETSLSGDDQVRVSLSAVVEEAQALTAGDMRQRGVGLEMKLKDLYVLGNESELTQVVINLVLNAAAATVDQYDEGPKRPPVRVAVGRRNNAKKPQVFIAVKDEGVGMDQQTLSRIFEPFYTTKPVGVGTGLGLSIAHEIISAHQGEIKVESTPGKGTTFYLCFPEVK